LQRCAFSLVARHFILVSRHDDVWIKARFLVCTFVSLVLSSSACADGLNSSYFVRFDSDEHSWSYCIVVLTLMMLANYALNFAVIGMPAIARASASVRTVALGLIALTILGQLADRIGAFAAIFLSMPIYAALSALFPSQSHGLDSPAFFYSLIGANLLCSGIAVGLLALFFLRRRWDVPRPLSWKIVLAAAIFTNPAWILFFPIGRA
jgi:hypothetical protein